MVDDIVQETAVRALLADRPFDDERGLLTWSRVVARHLAIDGYRRDERLAYGQLPEVASTTNVEYAVEQRLRLAAVEEAFPYLARDDQEILRLGSMSTAGTRRGRVHHAVRLHRARLRLLAIVDTVAAWLAWMLRPRLESRTRTRWALVSGSALVLAAALSLRLLPQTTSLPPTANRTGTTHPSTRQTRAAGRSSLTAAVSPSVPRQRPGGTTKTPPTYLHVGVPVEGGKGDIGAGLRPKQPGDHLACFDTIVAGFRCFDLPLVSTTTVPQ